MSAVQSENQVRGFSTLAGSDEYEEIPILDMGPYLAGEPGALEQIAAKVRHIQENIGFLVMTNHGFPEELLQAAYGKLQEFFDLPIEQKLKYQINDLRLFFENDTRFLDQFLSAL